MDDRENEKLTQMLVDVQSAMQGIIFALNAARKMQADFDALDGRIQDLEMKVETLEEEVPEHEHEVGNISDLDDCMTNKMDELLGDLTIQRR